MRRSVLASCVAALLMASSVSVEAASVRSIARMQRASTAPVLEAAAPALSAPQISALCLAKCAAEVAYCIHECDKSSFGLLGGCKEDCAAKGAECTAKCVLDPAPTPSPSPDPTPVRAVAPAVIDASNIEAAFEQLTRSPLASSSSAEVAAPAINKACLAKCAMRLTLCIHVCDHPGLLGGCKENCAAEAAECSAECAFEEEKEQMNVLVVPESAFTEVAAPATVDYKCLAQCAAQGATCIYDCYPAFGQLGGCKENCAATAALCTTECLLEEKVPSIDVQVLDSAEKAVALVVAQPAGAASVALAKPDQVGSADISALCVAKCAAEVAYCIYECAHPQGMLGGCKLSCAGKAALCTAACALKTDAPAALPSTADADAVVDATNVEATFAAQNALAVVPSPVGPLAMPTVDYKCLGKCAAECAYCIYECEHPSGLLGGCKENCAAKAAECSAECVLEEQSSEASAVIASSQKAAALVVAAPAVVPANVAFPTKCLAECAAKAALCVWDCEHPSFGLLGGCKENCAAAAAECSAECALDASAPMVHSGNVEAAFAELAVAAPVAAPAKQVAVSAPDVDVKCLAKCAAECAYCIYECDHPSFGLGGCKENCAATAAECSAECVLEEPSSTKAVLLSAEKAVALIEAPAQTQLVVSQQQVEEPMIAVCLAKCAAEAAYCVYECDHPSFGLGGCKEDCAGKAAICSAKCALALPAPAAAPALPTPAAAPVVVAEPAVVAALAPIVGAPQISALCLAKCAAEVAYCIHECDKSSFGLLGGCKEDCAAKGAECTAKCVL